MVRISCITLVLSPPTSGIPSVQIRLTKLGNDRHRTEIVRSNGSREEVALEMRSYLLVGQTMTVEWSERGNRPATEAIG